LDPDNMQRKLVNGECKPVYPHEYIRTNTIFEVIKAAGGLRARPGITSSSGVSRGRDGVVPLGVELVV